MMIAMRMLAAVSRSRFPHGIRPLSMLAVLALSFTGLGVARGQETEQTGGPPAAEARAEFAGDAGIAPLPDETTFQLKLSHEEKPLNFVEQTLARVDGGFAAAVNFLENVLFYRVFRRERRFIQFEESLTFVRPAGSDLPFQRLEQGRVGSETLSALEIERFKALGKLQLGPEGTSWRSGSLLAEGDEPRAVEVVTVNLRNDKYIFRDGRYHRLEPLLEHLSDSDSLSEAEAAEAAAAGQLQMTENPAGEPTFVQREEMGGAPIVVLWLTFGAAVFTLYMGFFNIRGFWHAIQVTRGKFSNPADPGEISHFQALSSALSATVGLGNIAGVTIAMTQGGPGAFFWMMLAGVLGMSSKFVESTLGQKYRIEKEDGTVLGGPMTYLYVGVRELGERWGIGPAAGALGLVLSIVFAVMCIFASFGGGNMFQANQSSQAMLAMLQLPKYLEMESLGEQIRTEAEAGNVAEMARLEEQRTSLKQEMENFGTYFKPVFGVVLALLVGAVIIGGIKRIGAATSRVVPTMCLIYIVACLFIIGKHALFDIQDLITLASQIFTEAFSPQAFGGGMLGVLVIGFQRAAFSNEAGCGSSAIAHSAARTKEPVREGCVAMLEPFIDTVVVCSMTALVILITGAWNNEEWIVEQGRMGATLTSKAFHSEISFFPYILSVAILLFAYSTIISWCYYGEKCWERLFGSRSTILYKCIYVGAVFVGAVVNLGAVLNFSDIMILTMAFPNIAGLLLLSPIVRRELRDYWRRYKAGEFPTFP